MINEKICSVNVENKKKINTDRNLLHKNFISFSLIFTPNSNEFYLDVNHHRTKLSSFLSQFTKKEDQILINFCKYLGDNKELLLNSNSDYKIFNLFKMCKVLL
jgi:hypothetical protein